MRVTFWLLLILAALSFAIAAVIAGTARQAQPGSTTAPGVVTALADGPYHAIVEVSPAHGPSFTFPANTQGGLAPRQRVTVRFVAAEPVATASVVVGDAAEGDGAVRGLVIVGIVLLVAALVGPLLVRWFPGLLGFRLRP